jgi:hypothetical protein
VVSVCPLCDGTVPSVTTTPWSWTFCTFSIYRCFQRLPVCAQTDNLGVLPLKTCSTFATANSPSRLSCFSQTSSSLVSSTSTRATLFTATSSPTIS